jgi:hypothetical protein
MTQFLLICDFLCRITSLRIEVDNSVIAARIRLLGVTSAHSEKEQYRILLDRFPGFLPDTSRVTTDDIIGDTKADSDNL